MANRYWVGGTASWDGTAGTKWATMSGGAGGASAPTTNDDVFFTNLSTGTVTIAAGNQGAKSINCTGFTGTITGTADITIAGSVTLVAGMTYTHTGTMTFTRTGTLTTAGKTFSAVTVNGSGITLTLGDALNIGNQALLVNSGSFNTANYNVTALILNSNSINTRAISLGSSTLTLSSSTPIFFSTSTGLTFNCGTSTINLTNTTDTSLLGGSQTFYNVSFSSQTTTNIEDANTFNDLTFASRTTAGVATATFDNNQTINGTLTFSAGTNATMRRFVRSDTTGTTRTLTCNAVATLTDIDFRDITFAGNCVSGGNLTGTRLGNCKGNTNITFDAAKTVYYRATGSANWGAGTSSWALTSGGTADHAAFPLAQDTAVFPAATYPASGSTTTINAVYNIGTIDMSLRTTNTMTLAVSSGPSVYGNWINGTGITISGTTSINFVGRVAQTLTSAGKSFTNRWILNSPGGTLTLADAYTTTNTTPLAVTWGTFDTANYNVTAAGISSDNANTRTITLGSSTLTLSGNSPITFTNSTNLTFTSGTSTITASGTGDVVFGGGGQTFYNVDFTGANATSVTVNGTNTFNNLSIAGRTTVGIKPFVFGADQTINGTLTLSAGTNATMRTFVRNFTTGTARTLTISAISSGLADLDFRDITISGTPAPISGTRFGNCFGNTGITFNAGTTKYWNLAAGGNWSATGWATGSGGTPAVNNFPLAQDTCVFEATGLNSGATVTVNTFYNIGTIDMSARTTNTMTLATGSTLPSVYGGWTNGTGTTLSGTETITFAGRSSHTITSAGKTFTQPVTIAAFGGTYTLQDALTTSGQLTHTAGTIDANGYNVTCTVLNTNNSNTRTLAFGSGTWTATSSGTAFSAATSTNLTVTGTGTISLTSSSTKIFSGGGIQTYPTINQGGTGQLTINGSNKFADITNTVIGAVRFAGGVTNAFTAFNLNGSAGNLLTLRSSTTAQATLKKSSAWLMGANSVNSGNNTGLSFTAGGGIDYLDVSFINGELTAILAYIQESISAFDALAVEGNYTAPVSETATANDTIVGGLLFLAALAEIATAQETTAAVRQFVTSILEFLTASDQTAVAASTFSATSADTATAQDATQGANTGSSSVTESAEISDQAATQFRPSTQISEQATASETSFSLMVFATLASESAAASDSTLVAPSTFSAVAAAVAAALDSGNAPGSVYNATLPIEGATASDSIIGAYLWNLINDDQSSNWQNINNVQSANWQNIGSDQAPVWVKIPTSNN